MQLLKLKNLLFGLTAVVAVAILMTACEQAAINNVTETVVPEGQAIHAGTPHECYSECHVEPDFITKITTRLPFAENETEVTVGVKDGIAYYEGDIMLGNLNNLQERGVASDIRRWTNSTIPYAIAAGFSEAEITKINNAAADITARTNLCVIPRTTEANFVTFVTSTGCSSFVGMQGGSQNINLATGCGFGSTIHELLHAAGIWHEQSREDRDEFVTINFDNISDGRAHNFNQRTVNATDIGDYDYGSLMHYGNFAFTRNSRPTITTIPPGITIGQRTGLSAGDIATVNTMYPTACGGGVSNSLSWNPTPTRIVNGNNTVTLDYSIDRNGVLLVQVYDASWSPIGEVYENVSPGTRTRTLTLAASNPSATGNHLQAKLLDSGWNEIGVSRLYENLPGVVPPPTSGCEILTNREFDSNISGWGAWNCNAYASGGAAVITGITTGANPWDAGFNQVGFTMERGKTYSVTFRARAANNRSIVVKTGMTGTPWTSYLYETVDLTTSMQTYTLTFTMDNPTDTNARFEFFFGNSSSNVYIENVSLKESDCGTTSTCEILTNREFDSNTSGWGSWNCNASASGGAANITGISTGANPWDAGFNQVGFTMERGKTYTVTFRARAASNRSIIVKTGMTGTPWTSYIYETVNLSTSMQTYTLTFTMDYPTDTNARFEFFFGNNSSNVYIDNVSMSEDC